MTNFLNRFIYAHTKRRPNRRDIPGEQVMRCTPFVGQPKSALPIYRCKLASVQTSTIKHLYFSVIARSQIVAQLNIMLLKLYGIHSESFVPTSFQGCSRSALILQLLFTVIINAIHFDWAIGNTEGLPIIECYHGLLLNAHYIQT